MVGRGEEMKQTVEYIKELTAIVSPTGFTCESTDYLLAILEDCRLPTYPYKGSVNVTIKGKNDRQQPYVTAHEIAWGLLSAQ